MVGPTEETEKRKKRKFKDQTRKRQKIGAECPEVPVEVPDAQVAARHVKTTAEPASKPAYGQQEAKHANGAQLKGKRGNKEAAENEKSGVEASMEGAKSQPVLPWMRVPIAIESGEGIAFHLVKGLDDRLQAALQAQGFTELYPVQASAWRCLAGGMSTEHDLCMCAPTGSGKTLAYALPILQRLAARGEDSTGALIVLPTRELAVQVFGVFAKLSPAVGLWTGLAAAQVSEAAEALAFLKTPPHVLVATPGRLMAHMKAERPAISLARLQFLIVDETDRLLRQAYQDWLPSVLAATAKPAEPLSYAPARLVKIVASATLTQDPAKIGRLALHAPRYISTSASDHRYKVPKQLKEYKVVCAAKDKPLVLMALLHHMKPARTIVFTGSLIATDRYCALKVVLRRLRLFLQSTSSLGETEVAIHSAGRRGEGQGLTAFRAGAARILVASDALTRGMDVTAVEVVVNYDPAVYPKTYVHRAGRTARAGQSGTVITMLTTEQVRHFKIMLRKVDNTYVKDFTLPPKLVTSLRPEVREALFRASEHSQSLE